MTPKKEKLTEKRTKELWIKQPIQEKRKGRKKTKEERKRETLGQSFVRFPRNLSPKLCLFGRMPLFGLLLPSPPR